MTFRPSDMIWGPSMAYQLGLVSHPHGGFNFESADQFPFFSVNTFPGLRPQNAVLQDNYTQRTNLEARTTRPLWPGAKLDLNWRTEKSYNRNQTVITDSLGVPKFTNIFATETFSRTYLTLPSIFGLNLFDNNIEHVIELYEQKRPEIEATSKDSVEKRTRLQNALSDAFHDGMEAFSSFSGAIGKFLPAINWSITWEGLEKWGIFDGLAKRIRIEHKYTSRYNETAQTTDNGRAVANQQIQYGFQPLIGVNMTFDKEKLGGILTAQLRLITQNSYQLNTSNKSMIAATENTKLELQASYTMDEFKFPLLGIELENEFELSFLGSYNKNRRARFIVTGADDVQYDEEGNTLDGNTQIVIEPRASYSLSRIVRASAFVRYEGTITEGASNPGYSTTQIGVDIRISIAGGR
jgi:cell surface protein SprA